MEADLLWSLQPLQREVMQRAAACQRHSEESSAKTGQMNDEILYLESHLFLTGNRNCWVAGSRQTGMAGSRNRKK